jgi:predicted nucleic acid-binding protein
LTRRGFIVPTRPDAAEARAALARARERIGKKDPWIAAHGGKSILRTLT